jgi:predicted permease
VADWIAGLLLEADDARRLLDDLADEYAEFQRPHRLWLAADVWYLRQVLTSVWVLRRTSATRTRGFKAQGGGGVTGGSMGIESLARDVGYAFRQLRRSPTFTLTAALTLALGIGATTAIFSVVRTVLLDALPYDHPERIVRAWAHTDDGDITDFSFRVVEYEQLRGRSDVFEAVGAEFPASFTVLIDRQEAHQVQGRMITGDFFDVFGTVPELGTMFSPDEIAAGDRVVAVVTHGFWTRFLGGDPAALGSTIDINGNPFTVVGVLPESYAHISGTDAQIFIPFTLGTSGWIAHWLDLFVRLQPGVAADRAQGEINAVLDAIGETDRRSAGWHATVEELHEMVVGDVRPAIWATFAMVGLVLLIACVNVANLTLARSTTRTEELSVRRALGAGRGRLARQLLVENLAVASVGGVLGLGVAMVGLRAVVAAAPPSIPRIADVALDPLVLGFSATVTLSTAVLFGLAPMLQAGRGAMHPGLARRGDGGSPSRGGLLGGLVVSEVALALMLLVSTGLMVRTLAELDRQELGFQRGGAATFRVSVPSSRYPTSADTHDFYTRLRAELMSLPGVTAVGAGSDLPVSGEGAVASVTTAARVEASVDEAVTVLQRRATAGFFGALGTPLLSGREFDGRDRADGETTAIISASLARTLFPDGEAVGQRIGWGSAPDEDDWMTVVGVVGDVRYTEVEAVPDPQLYQAHPQSAVRQMAVVVRTDGDPLAIVDPARNVVRSLDPLVPVYDVGTLNGLVDLALAGRRFTMMLFAVFGTVALALTVGGIYGVLAFVVGRRRREIGVRMALGARSGDVSGLVLGQGLRFVLIGLVLGGVGALGATRLLESLLFGVPATDPATFGAVAILLSLVGWAACWIPARRAARTDPMAVLREE